MNKICDYCNGTGKIEIIPRKFVRSIEEREGTEAKPDLVVLEPWAMDIGKAIDAVKRKAKRSDRWYKFIFNGVPIKIGPQTSVAQMVKHFYKRLKIAAHRAGYDTDIH
ncbi:MAG: hypothetical protein KGO96_06770 [Elusimicrobia bacterium]|nr:hypothetical protein [Elusimicrobiota bacterium]